MANANVNLPYGVTKSIRVVGKNASNTSERPITNITFTSPFGTVVIAATGDPNVFTVTNNNPTSTGTGNLTWNAKNELNANITGLTPFVCVPADPATTIETTEL